jgi:hypothetical protein
MSSEYNLYEPLLDKYEEEEIDKEIQQNIREGFIAKVYGILACQLLLLFLIVLLGFINSTFHELLLTSKFIYILTFILFIMCILIIIFNPSLLQKVPINYIILFIFTFSYSWWIALYTINFSPSIVLISIFLTLVTVVTLTIYVQMTKNDFSVIGGILINSFVLLLSCSLVLIFVDISLFNVIMVFFGLIIFSLYLLFDVQLVIGKGQIKYGEDDYIFAALNLYIDIIGIFVRILELVGNNNN